MFHNNIECGEVKSFEMINDEALSELKKCKDKLKLESSPKQNMTHLKLNTLNSSSNRIAYH